jgi:Na+-driven multidrug efflux pump
MSVLWRFGEIWPEGFIRLFTHDSLLVESSIAPARVMLCVMCAIGFPMVTGNFYTSIGMAKKAIFLSLTRQVLFLIPLILGMPILFEQLGWDPLWGVWWSWPISDTLSVLTAAILINKDMRTFRLE